MSTDYYPLTRENIDDIVKYELANSYGHVPPFTLLEYTSKELTELAGYLGNYYQISLTANALYCTGPRQHPMKLFAKMIPKAQVMRDFHAENKSGFKENQFYGKILPKLISSGCEDVRDAVPRCYLMNDEGSVFLDLVADSNYETGNARESMPLKNVKLGLEAMAKLHASGLLFEANTNQKLLDLFPNAFQEMFYNEKEISKNLIRAGKLGIGMAIELYYDARPETKDSHPNATTLKNFAQQAIDKLSSLVHPSSTYRNTVCHGDLGGNNLLFTPDTEPKGNCKMVDFQSYRYGPCTQDVTHFLHFALFTRERKKHWGEMLDYYYYEFGKIFERHGRKVEEFMTYEDFLKSVEIEEELALYQTMTRFQIAMIKPEILKPMLADPKVCKKFLFEDRQEHVRINWGKDEVYRERLCGVIEDLREHYLTHYDSS